MFARKLLNNNAVVVDDGGIEKVVMGRGVGYRLSIGDPIDAQRVEKVYLLSSDGLNERFQEIVSGLSFEQMRMIEEIVNTVRLELGRPVGDSIYVSLADHVNFAISNYEAGIRVPNGLRLDVVRFYPDEYRLGQQALDIIERYSGHRLPDDEAAFIALHIVNAEIGGEERTDVAVQITQVIADSLAIVREHFDINIAENSLTHFRFINHLRYFAQRILSNSVFPEDASTRELLDIISEKYPEAYACACDIERYAKESRGAEIGCDELLYLTIHIHHAIQAER